METKSLSERVKKISPSMTIAVDSKAKQLKREGRDIVIFGAGEPDFPTPDNIKDAAIRAINDNFTKYTAPGGVLELKRAVVSKFKRENSISYDISEVIAGCGGKHTLFNAILTLIDKGDEVIIPKPYWVSYIDMVKLADGIPAVCDTDEKFRIKADYIKGKITKRTKAIIINSPSNPTGAVIDEKELRKIADIAIEKNIYVISDEVYEHFIYDNKKSVSIASLDDEIKKLAITVNSVSKTYSMTGWRIGFCGADRDIIKSMDALQSQSTSNPTSIAQMAAVEALSGPQNSVREMLKAFDGRRKFMVKRLNKMRGVECAMPEGAFYCFPSINGTKMKSADFCSRLLDEALVAAVPGIAFGLDSHIRLSYAASTADIEKGIARIEKWLRGL